MSKGENVVKWIKGQRISWLGHLERREENRMPKMIFSQELEGPRRRGKPRKRWKEEGNRNLQVLGVRRYCSTGQKPTAGCSANGRRGRRRSGFVRSICSQLWVWYLPLSLMAERKWRK
jgi:hypothetical protein